MSAPGKLRSTDFDQHIVKARAAGLVSVASVYETIQDILKVCEVIEAEDARRETARVASIEFQKGLSQ